MIETITSNILLLYLLIGILSIWELIWKGFGLWYSARKKQKAWFIAILIFNTIGILPIIYIFFFRKKKKTK